MKVEKIPVLKRDFYFLAISLLFATIISFVFIWPVRWLPTHGEFASIIVDGAESLAAKNYQPFSLSELGTVVSPLYQIYLNQVWTLLGKNLISTHFSILPFFILYLVSIFSISRKFLSDILSLVTMFVVAFIPFVIAGLQLNSWYLTSGSLLLFSITLWLDNKKIASMIMLSIASLLHWSTLLSISFFLVDLVSKKADRKEIKTLLVPVATMFIWLFYNATSSGWWFTPSGQLSLVPSIQLFISYLFFILKAFFLFQINWLIFLPSVIGMTFSIYKQQLKKDTLIFVKSLSAFVITSIIFYSATGSFELYSITGLAPLLALMSMYYLRNLQEYIFNKDYDFISIGLSFLIIIIAISQWNVSRPLLQGFQTRAIENLSYQDSIYVNRMAAGKLQGEFSNAEIYGVYPESYQLTNPTHGYVTKALDFKGCNEYQPNNEKTQIIYAHLNHQSQLLCDQLLGQLDTTSLERIEYKNRWVELFLINQATESAANFE